MRNDYTVDLTKTPHELFSGLLIHNNPLVVDYMDTLAWRDITPTRGAERNTQCIVYTTSEEFDLKDVTVKYDRVNLDVLFSLVEANLRKIYQSTLTDAELIEAMRDKYGIYLDTNSYTFTSSDGYITITAKDTNVAVCGSVHVALYRTLNNRLAKLAVNCFELPFGGPLEEQLANTIIDGPQLPSQLAEGQAYLNLLTYNIDFTHYRRFLELNSNGTFRYEADLLGCLVDTAFHTFPEGTVFLEQPIVPTEEYDTVLTSKLINTPEFNGIYTIKYKQQEPKS